LGSAFEETLRSPIGLGAQVLMLVLLVALLKVDWRRFLDRRDPV
jgi:hypothetical protein